MTTHGAEQTELEVRDQARKILSVKVVVWDLDHTIWNGVLLEDNEVTLLPGVVDVIKELDQRGILQSIASKNYFAPAMAKLEALAIAEYFLYPQINWGAKSTALKTIAASINVGLDTLAFIDDDACERAEISYGAPEVLCLDAVGVPQILSRLEFIPRFNTVDSRNRRLMYMSDIRRNLLEEQFEGPKEEFLATLSLQFNLARATEGDLQRIEELTRRTRQLNTTGYAYSHDQLVAFMRSPEYDLFIASLEDKFGTYGKIGLCLVERSKRYWTLKLLLMSCRVSSRGVGSIMINYVIGLAKKSGVRLRAELIKTASNRMMFVTYRLNNFQVIAESNGLTLLENDCSEGRAFPKYASVRIIDERSASDQ